jgi:regulator of protease activity HflC (stomatin/prohibitin superfamily)
MWQLIGPAGTITIILVILIISGVRILKEYQRGVIFRLGRMVAPRGPGITYVIPVIEKMTRVDLRTVTMDLPPQDVITKDNVSVKVSAVLYFRVVDANRAIREVEPYLFATAQVAQVTLRSVCGQAELDELLAEREQINTRIQTTLDSQTEPWGIKVVSVEIKHIDLPQEISAPWQSKPKPSARGARKSSMPKVNLKRLRNLRPQQKLSPNSQAPSI